MNHRNTTLRRPGLKQAAWAHTPTGVLATLALAASVLAAPAGAVEPPAEVGRSHFQDEIQRCVAQLRPGVDASAARLRFEVTRVDRTAGWYVFRLRATPMDAAGGVQGPVLESRCAASRWDQRTVLEREYAGGSLQQLLAQAPYASDLSRVAVTR